MALRFAASRLTGYLVGQLNRVHTSSCFGVSHSPDYYTVLGLNKSATTRDVKAAYFAKAKRFHPDSNPSEEARQMFQLLAEAYEVLADEKKRKNFDECGSAGFVFGGMSEGPQRPTDHTSYDAEELFEKIFGEAKMGEIPQYNDWAASFSGHDSTKEYNVRLSFEQAAKGTEFAVDMYKRVECPKCFGDQSELGFTWQVCVYCEGTGVETEKIGHVLTRRACAYCNGTKRFHKFKCNECEGTGVVVAAVTFSFDIPPGVEDGQVLRVPIPFDLMKHAQDNSDFFYIYISVEKSDYFRRDDLDVHSDTDVSPAQALLGGAVAVRGLHKDLVDVCVAPGTCSHSSVLVPDEGVVRSDRLVKGSHLVHLGIRVPDSLTEAERRIWTAFAVLEQKSPDAQFEGCVNGVDSVIGHKFEFGAIDPVSVTRVFNKKVLKPSTKDSAAVPVNKREDGFGARLKKFMSGA